MNQISTSLAFAEYKFTAKCGNMRMRKSFGTYMSAWNKLFRELQHSGLTFFEVKNNNMNRIRKENL